MKWIQIYNLCALGSMGDGRNHSITSAMRNTAKTTLIHVLQTPDLYGKKSCCMIIKTVAKGINKTVQLEVTKG